MDTNKKLAGLEEIALRHIAEMTAMRIAITCLLRHVPDAPALLKDFEQSAEEQRHLIELGGQQDPRFEQAVARWSKWIAQAGTGPLARD